MSHYMYASYSDPQDEKDIKHAIELLKASNSYGLLWEVLMEACNDLKVTPVQLTTAIRAGMMEWDI
jgi:hypothetical protein